MKYVRYQQSSDNPAYGILEGDIITKIDGNLFGEWQKGSKQVARGAVKLLAPCLPSKIIGVGRNYLLHIKETNAEVPSYPLIFLVPGTSVINPGDAIIHPKEYERVDYEGEIGVVIGKKASKVKKADASDYILGYTCSNDVSCRTMIWSDKHWSRGKGQDTFSPIGPVITDEIDPMNVMLETRLNGDVKQHSSTSDMLFDIPTLIEFITAGITLLPGDIIQTGTPSGIGPIKEGDVVEVEIEGIGILSNPVVMEK